MVVVVVVASSLASERVKAVAQAVVAAVTQRSPGLARQGPLIKDMPVATAQRLTTETAAVVVALVALVLMPGLVVVALVARELRRP